MTICKECGVDFGPENAGRPWCVECSPYCRAVASELACMKRSLVEGTPTVTARNEVLGEPREAVGWLAQELGVPLESLQEIWRTV